MEPREAYKPWEHVPPPAPASFPPVACSLIPLLDQRVCLSQLKLAEAISTEFSQHYPTSLLFSCVLLRPLAEKLEQKGSGWSAAQCLDFRFPLPHPSWPARQTPGPPFMGHIDRPEKLKSGDIRLASFVPSPG